MSEALAGAQRAGWVQPLPFERLGFLDPAARLRCADALRTLRRLKLGNVGIRRLVIALRDERARDTIIESWPNLGADLKALQRVVDQARALASELASATPLARAQIATAGLQTMGDSAAPNRLMSDLQQLASGCAGRLVVLPKQGRAACHPHIIHAVALAMAPIDVKPAVSATGRFYSACKAAFTLAGVTNVVKGQPRQPSPAGSIRAYLKARSSRKE